ncbi:MAG: hypothetical protein P1S59_09895, partial [bacterium]|nr:hypothetical protein [bacterium]
MPLSGTVSQSYFVQGKVWGTGSGEIDVPHVLLKGYLSGQKDHRDERSIIEDYTLGFTVERHPFNRVRFAPASPDERINFLVSISREVVGASSFHYIGQQVIGIRNIGMNSISEEIILAFLEPLFELLPCFHEDGLQADTYIVQVLSEHLQFTLRQIRVPNNGCLRSKGYLGQVVLVYGVSL